MSDDRIVTIGVDGLCLVIDGLPDRGPLRIEMSRQTAALVGLQLAAAVHASPPEPGDLVPPHELELLFEKASGHA